MQNTQDSFLVDTFTTEKNFLLFGCYYPSQKYKISSVIIGIFMFTYSWTEFFSMVAVIFVERNNLTKIAETLVFCMTEAAFLFKLTNFLYYNNLMTEVEHILQKKIFTELIQTEMGIVKEHTLGITYLARLFRVLCILTVTFYGLFPFIDNDPEHMLPLPGWFPFDVKAHHNVVGLAQTCGIGIGAFINSTLDVLPTILITLGSAQFDILKSRLINVTKLRSKDRVKEVLKKCVVYHDTLLKYIEKVEDLFSVGIFMQFTASVIVICLTGFQMLVISVKSVQFILLMIYFTTLTCQIVLYCWYGNELMYKSMDLPEACYMSDWNDCDTEICVTLFIIMERGKKPVVIRAAKLFSLTLTTLMKILKSSYSYFAVLQSLYRNS